MSVYELIWLLEQHPPDLRVVVNGYEDGYDDLTPEQLSLVKIALNTGNHPWEGQHGGAERSNEKRTQRRRGGRSAGPAPGIELRGNGVNG